MKNIILAKNAGFCFGVKRAVDTSLEEQIKQNKTIYTLGPLIHNNDVVKFLKENKIYPIDITEIDKLNAGDTIIIRSHGVPKATIKYLKDLNLNIVDATCPFVTNIQKKVQKYSNLGYKIIILGDKEHPEVVGINGWCNDNAIIYKDGNLNAEVPKKVCAVSQTTEKNKNWEKMISTLSLKTKELLAFNTICSATEERQKSVEELAKNVDIMIVVGGKNSSNTTKLFQIANGLCAKTVHIENASELDVSLLNNANNKNIGITAGASTPDWVIREVIGICKGQTNN